MKRILITAAVYAGALVVTLPIAFVVVIILAGPHSSMLPSILQPMVLLLGWAAVIFLPITTAAWTWKKLGP